MKSKKEHIDHWITQSKEDWESAFVLYSAGKYLHSLFFAHLAIEKVCKAHWINASESNIPPKTHNLIFLLSHTRISLSDTQKEFLLELNRFQIEGRYPEQQAMLHRAASITFTKDILSHAKEIHTWLLNKLQ